MDNEHITYKSVAMLSGGDWADASVDLLDIPKSVDLDVVAKEHRQWYTRVYCPEFSAGNKPKYFTLTEWLIEKHGAIISKVVHEYWE